MSGIAGIFNRNGKPVKKEDIRKMNDILSHRGPDGSNIIIKDQVALAHQMLHTTPESIQEKLPLQEDGLIITADARIDNREELAPQLNLKNIIDEPDSLYILKAYQKWGEKCPDKLLGDFAFAIWDSEKEELFCARDHMGVKPFYYYLSDDAFYFGTEIKALLTLEDVPRKINELKIAYYLTKNFFDQKLTFYEIIVNLLAAHSMKVTSEGCELRKYWSLDPELKITLDSDDEYITKFRIIFQEAVNCRLRSAFPMGFELSGGLDSSSIVCMAKNIINKSDSHFKEINTISYVLNELPHIDESYYIKNVVNTGDIKANYIRGDLIGPLEEMETILWYHDQPFFSPHISIAWKLYKKMNEKNIRIILSGEGGDAIGFQGNHYLKELFTTFKWGELIKETKYYSKRFNQNAPHTFIYNILYPALPNVIKRLIQLLLQKEEQNNSILDDEFANRYGGIHYLLNLSEGSENNLNFRGQHHLLLSELNNVFLQTSDHNGAAYSIETRFPFLDKRLIEFAYAVPDNMKFKLGWDRYLHRMAMTDIIPPENQWRPLLYNPGLLYKRNLLSYEKDYLEKIINNDMKMDYVNMNILKDIYHEYKSGNTTNETFYLWLMMLLHFWLNNSLKKRE